MAIGRLNQRVGKVGKGLAHFNYIMREDKYKAQAEKLEIFENSDFGNMPDWAKDKPSLFWKMADQNERKNGSTYRENIIALPRELNEQQRLDLVNDWIKSEIGDKHPYAFAIHTPKALDGEDQPHVHLMWSERTLDGIERGPDQFFKRYNSKHPERGGCEKSNKNSTWTNRKAELVERRMRWQEVCNEHLARAGLEIRIDMRNWKERGLEQAPVNIAMSEINKPEIRQEYQQKLLLKREAEQLDRQWQVFADEREIARTDCFIENTKLQLERTIESNREFARRIYEANQTISNGTREQAKGVSILEDPNVFITWSTDYLNKYKVEQAMDKEQFELEQEDQEQARQEQARKQQQEKLRLEQERQRQEIARQEQERQRQEQARQQQEKLRLEQERQRQELARQEQERQQQEQERLERERYKRSMLIECPFFDTPLSQLAKPKMDLRIIEEGLARPKQVISLKHALNLYNQYDSNNWISARGGQIKLELMTNPKNNQTEDMICNKFIELAEQKDTQKLNELVQDFLTKTAFEFHLTSMVEFTSELGMSYNAYADKISFYRQLDLQVQRDGLSMANKLENNAQSTEINKDQSKVRIEKLIESLNCKQFYEPRAHRDLNLVEFLEQTNATISKWELEKVNAKIEDIIKTQQPQQQPRLEQERQARVNYQSPNQSKTKDRDDGPSFGF